jgi:hypothetical protein
VTDGHNRRSRKTFNAATSDKLIHLIAKVTSRGAPPRQSIVRRASPAVRGGGIRYETELMISAVAASSAKTPWMAASTCGVSADACMIAAMMMMTMMISHCTAVKGRCERYLRSLSERSDYQRRGDGRVWL